MILEIPKGAIQINKSIFVELFFNQNGRINIRYYFKLPRNNDDIPYELNKKELIRLCLIKKRGAYSEKKICMIIKKAQKLASFLGEYAETINKMKTC